MYPFVVLILGTAYPSLQAMPSKSLALFVDNPMSDPDRALGSVQYAP